MKSFNLVTLVFLLSLFFLNIIAKAENYFEQKLKVPNHFNISIYIEGIKSPRQIAQSNNGTIFVATRDKNLGQILALFDSDQNGQVDEVRVLASDLLFSGGISIYKDDLFFSEVDKVWKVSSIEKWLQKNVSGKPDKILFIDGLPSDTWHGSKWLKHDDKGRLYFNIGAPCNVCLKDDKRYATIMRNDNGTNQIVASGVRNSVGFDFHPVLKKLYFTDNGRDWMGDDEPSCELNRLDKEGDFFGFPFKHAKDIVDPEYGNVYSGYKNIDPILELGAHVAPTGVSFYQGEMFPTDYKNNLFITLHGSWNRSKKSGYKVIRVIFNESGEVVRHEDFITGFLSDQNVHGRPSSVLTLIDGSMLVADDFADKIYRVTFN